MVRLKEVKDKREILVVGLQTTDSDMISRGQTRLVAKISAADANQNLHVHGMFEYCDELVIILVKISH
jgi:hypothetical protein